jgi:hypothetical protein
LILTAALCLAAAPFGMDQPALAYSWPNRLPGTALPDEPQPPPSGWRLGLAMTFPYTMGLSLAYLWPTEGVMTFKLGGSWGILNGRETIASRFSDYRLYGSLMYYLSPAAQGGPYVETGLDVAKSSGAILPLSWPVVPHIGFGTNGHWTEQTGWDVNFSATANGVLSLEGGLLF